MSHEDEGCEHIAEPAPGVIQFIKDVYQEGANRGLSYGDLNTAAERLHLVALFHRFEGDTEAVAAYLRMYGEHMAELINGGVIEFSGDGKQPTVH